MTPKDFYAPKKDAAITEKRFRDLFFPIHRSDSFRLVHILSNIQQVVWDTGKYAPKCYGYTTFYELGDDGHGGHCMREKFRAKNYNELVDYLFKIGEQWRFEK